MCADSAPWRRQSSQLSGNETPGPGVPTETSGSDGFVGFAPPPPPPPAPGTTVRLNTQIPDVRGKQGSCREPPAAIQNAMMTKDKKPFTYTPGGLDLSQIRSPRMQRRISRNAHNEGVSGDQASPKPPPLGQGALPPSALAAMQPQLPVQVFPSGVPQHTSAPKRPVLQEVPQPPPPPTPPTPPTPTSLTVEPGSLYVPPVTSRVQLGSLYVPPVTNAPTPQQQQQPQGQMSPLPSGGLNKAPTPWMSQRTQPQPVAAWASRAEDPATRTVQGPPGTRIIPIQVEGQEPPQSSPSANTRVIPIQVEGARGAPTAVPGPQQLYQQQQYQQQQQQQYQQQQQQQYQQQQQQYQYQQQQPYQQQQCRPVYMHNKFNPPPQSPGNVPSAGSDNIQEAGWGATGAPIQSRAFKVLQKITDTDVGDGGGVDHIAPGRQGVPMQQQQQRKLQLNEDDRALMNKFKAQVSEEQPGNEEENPRYRGGHIPSRVFRMLDNSVPQSSAAGQGRQMPTPQPTSEEGPTAPYIPPSEQQVLEPKKYTGGAIPSRSFRMLQAMTASPEDCVINAQDPNLPNSRVGYDEYPPYWCGYYPQQAMDPYSAMYAYMAEMNAAYGYPPIPYPPMYYPHPFARYPHGSDSDDYSSTDEMAYYGANFARNAAAVHQPNIIVTPSVASKSEDDETTSDSDTEVEEEDSSGRDLKAIRSVSDISIYKSGSEGLLHSSDVNDEESEREEDTDEEEEEEPSENLPHQLSVIFEESEHSDFGTRHDEDSSTATLDESDADLELPESPSSTVTVCLPLKLKFSRSENDEEVTTVIVGDSQVKHSESGNASDENIPILKENIKCTGHHKPDVSVTISFPSKTNSGNIKDVGKLSPVTCESANVDHIMHQVSASDLDCYETAESDSDVSVSLSLPLHQRQHKASISTASPSNDDDKLKTDNSDSPVSHWEDDSSSTVSIQTVKLDSEVHGHSSSSDADTVISVETKSPALTTVEDDDESSEESEEEEEEEEEEDDDDDDDDEASEDEENSSSSSSAHSFVSNKEPIKQNIGTKEDHTESIVQKIYDICTKLDDDKEGGKRLGEESEEDDSGVTSDMSRQISDADTESDDLIKLTRYQRASTHSRLFKLLQDECEKSDDEDDSKEERDKPRSREQLTLPLQTHSDLDSLSSSSGVASPSSPTITDRLVKELVHSLLQRKKGKRLKKLPLAKLHAAALRILQEDMDPYDTGSSATSEETSPIRNSVAPASQVNIPYGANYYDYCDYYNSWANAASYYGADPSVEYDIVPSRAFKLLQEHAQPEGFSSGVINGLWAKCPRIPSSKNLRKDLTVTEEETQTTPCPT